MSGSYQKQTHAQWWTWTAVVLFILIAIATTSAISTFQIPSFQTSESAPSDQVVTVDTLRAARPDFTGGYVPESTLRDPRVTVDTLRAARPDFTGGYVPESTLDADEE